MAKKIVKELAKFSTVGLVNTFIDLLVLNLLSFAFSISSGPGIILLNIIAFSCAIINSYLLNKRWTFRKKEEFYYKELLLFIIISFFSGIINTAIVFYGTTFLNYHGVGDLAWLNVMKMTASIASAVFNFFGYKLIVFKKKKSY
ncbi:MAG: GtrA family protein [Candidatus Paceibacterota bacterium]